MRDPVPSRVPPARPAALASAAVLSFALSCLAPPARAGEADGLWRTEKNDEGGFLEVRIEPCAEAPAKTCGAIVRAANDEGEDPDYPHLGKLIVRAMVPDGPRAWRDGSIWAPDDDRTYAASMRLVGAGLKVEGCVLIFCRSQVWTPAK